ncbi:MULTISPECIES: type II secretion system minor pseudopilin GspH [Marinobacter]|jgi:general secretion pathway protein H|uniref:Type II secretion system protein H n=1 Tax=Marinobacter salarius TaxID=1420917 RepID=A0A1W6KA96_9GAMM|nr:MULTISPECIES: type II secretion system minor pseudopilin GspH [Marinobacter]ARM84356.1 type II secretion system protein GspH [Marinobacter salarius]AZR43170.1 type II secretion system protein H [Marinobacter salarius]KXJ48312.1 MAG: type II secretion system protein GspH [Marinobacter sp. Hex_13]MAB50610.1 type II secretion system protein GspH [Marinobacter sp.]MBJ7277793.1 type II secretion system minor pseudopilin GspH [Marinobacter salarius]|tara:strand:- start:883 stop:1437 length:555 start_codon:yes stop_codon:yes gene_type:complete
MEGQGLIVLSRTRQSGFTLIEILVVLVVVGLLAALAVMSMGGSSRDREMENEVRELYLLMQTASEQAILNNTELGLILEEDSYRFVAWEELSGEWKQPAERMFRTRSFPEWITATEYIESDTPRLASDEDELRPDVVFFSSGETTPFEIEFLVGRDDSRMHTIASDGVSPLEWRHPGSEEVEEE